MSHHGAHVHWQRAADAPFTDNRYPRVHQWRFDGGAVVAASSSPQVVPVPLSDAAAVDPEEAFVAALASCHLLWFLSLAAGDGWVVDDYADHAQGAMGRNAEGKQAMLEVTLRPRVRFKGRKPTPEQHEALHRAAHDACFVAHSVRCTVRCLPDFAE